jgi:hypothetical protein
LGGGKSKSSGNPKKSRRSRDLSNGKPTKLQKRIQDLESFPSEISRILNIQTYYIPSQQVSDFQSELQVWLSNLPEILKTKIDLIKTALEEERAGETIRINGTLKVIVNRLITRLEGLGSDHLVELISFLKNYTP